MKAMAQQKVLENLIKKGSMSALSDEAQGDSTNLSSLIKSVKLDFTSNKITVESATNLSSIRISIDSGKENGIEVKEEGVSVVDAKELLDWVSKQPNANIGVNMVKLEVPESVISGENDMEDTSKTSVLKIGDLKLVSKDSTSTGSKWAMSSFDPNQLPKTFKPSSSKKDIFTIAPQKLLSVISSIIFSTQDKDYMHVFDSFSFQKVGDKIYVGATDQKRCAIYDLTGIISNQGNYFESEVKILIPATILQNILKIADESMDVKLVYDSEKHTVYIEQKDFNARISLPEKNVYGKFPTLDSLIKKQYAKIGSVPKDTLQSRLVTISMVNKESALFFFQPAKNKIFVHGISEGGKAPNTCTCPFDPASTTSEEIRIVWGVGHIMDMLKAIKDTNVSFMLSDNNQGLKIVSEADPNLSFYGMSIDNPKYAKIKIE